MEEIVLPGNWLRHDPITDCELCPSCWNGIHFIRKKRWNDKKKRWTTKKLSACCRNGCNCYCKALW